mmetsp:Transcript_30212/g.34318  ORF Transcript_30212/g.34318 Transcript_30212/m.34318 type:complete len:125 (-) Transcript_30212:304-678(-)
MGGSSLQNDPRNVPLNADQSQHVPEHAHGRKNNEKKRDCGCQKGCASCMGMVSRFTAEMENELKQPHFFQHCKEAATSSVEYVRNFTGNFMRHLFKGNFCEESKDAATSSCQYFKEAFSCRRNR